MTDQQLAEAGGLAFDLADAETPLLVSGVDAEIIAAHGAAADQFGQLIARLDAAGPAVGMFVDAELIEGGRIDAVEPVGDIAQLQRAAVADGWGGGPGLGSGERYEQRNRCR